MTEVPARFRAAIAGAVRIAAGLSLLASSGVAAGLGDGAGPTLFEKIAGSPLVVHGRCRQEGMRATVEVLEVLKGTYKAPQLEVRYHFDNLNRDPGSQKIGFEPGAESILVLEPEKNDDGRVKGETRFVLAGGVRGKIDLPPEGGEALVAAVRKLVAIQSLRDQNEIWEAEKGLIAETNPILVEAGFDEVLKFRLGCEALVPPLLAHLAGPRPEFRRRALQVIGQIFGATRRTGKEIESCDLLVRETLARANSDDSAETRAEAVRALRELHRAALAEPLEALARSDPSQIVRYEAQVALLDLKSER